MVDKDGRLHPDGSDLCQPGGPQRNPDPIAAAEHIRVSFGRMAMNDEETVALIAGGHTLGKMHGPHNPKDCVGPEPAGAPITEQGLGWKSRCGKGMGVDTVTSGLEARDVHADPMVARIPRQPVQFRVGADQESGGSPSVGPQGHESAGPGRPRSVKEAPTGDAHHGPLLNQRPEYRKISKRFLDNPEEFNLAFAKAWYKLTHRDLGPHSRLLGSEVPQRSCGKTQYRRLTTSSSGERDRGPQGQDPRLGLDGSPTGIHRMGFGIDVPRHGHARRANGARSASRRKRTGRPTNQPSWQKPSRLSRRSSRVQQGAARRYEGLACRSHRARWGRGSGESSEGRRC